MKNIFGLIITLTFLSVGIAKAQIAGGEFTLDQSVIATGGGTSSGGNFTATGTSGQAAAGARPAAAALNAQNGFWSAVPLAPTSASVRIGGRVTTADGRGIRNVYVTLIEANGTLRAAVTGSFGYYSFNEIGAGQTVLISVRAKRFTFAAPTVILSVAADDGEIDFIADPEILSGKQ